MKNYLGQTFWLVLLVAGLLAGLSLVSQETTLNGFTLRRMDIFSDVRDSSAHTAPAVYEDTLAAWQPDTTGWAAFQADSLTAAAASDTVKVGPLPPKDSAYYGEIIEDYTFDQRGLERFFAAVDSIRQGRTVRVAFYGDSFVEGDIVLGDLRDSLQSAWGGQGVGYVPVTSEVSRFKRTLIHDFKGFSTASIIKKSESRPLYGINGFAYFPQAGATLRYEGTRQFFKNTRAWSRLRLFYGSDSLSSELVFRINGAPAETALLPRTRGRVGVFDFKQPGMYDCRLEFPAPHNLRLYGASLESGPGFYLDNFSLRGNSGGPLSLLKPAFIHQFDAQQHYDLIVVQYGLNAASTSLKNINWYKAELDRTFAHLRVLFPATPVLIMSVPDRAGMIGGELASLPSVAAITAMQRDLARKHGFLFYDLFHGMGGPGTMIAFAEAQPRLANLDYTHLTHEGGKVVGHRLAALLLREQANWRNRSQ